MPRLLEKEETHAEPLVGNKTEEYVNFVAESCVPMAMSLRKTESESLKDPELENVRQCLLPGKWHTLRATEFMLVKNELSCINNVVLRGTRIVYICVYIYINIQVLPTELFRICLQVYTRSDN